MKLRYFCKKRFVYLGDPAGHSTAKLICTAESQRLAGKVASILNAGDTRQGRAHEYFMYGTGNQRKTA